MIVRSTLLELLEEPGQLVGVDPQDFALPPRRLELLDARGERGPQPLDVVLAGGHRRGVLGSQAINRFLEAVPRLVEPALNRLMLGRELLIFSALLL
jgi:hypothetical protein